MERVRCHVSQEFGDVLARVFQFVGCGVGAVPEITNVFTREFWEQARNEEVQRCINVAGALKARDGDGRSLLHWAAAYGSERLFVR